MLNPLTHRLHLFQPFLESGQTIPWWLLGGIDPAHCVAAYQGIGVASYTASKINLANPGTHDLVNNGTDVSWSSTNGWGVFNSINKVFRINYLVDGNHSALCRFSGATASSGSNMIFGAYGVVGSRMHIAPHRELYTSGRYSSGEQVDRTPHVIAGVCGVVGRYAWVNSVKTGGAIGTFSGTALSLFGLGGASISNDTIGYFSACSIQAFALYDVVLTDAQANLVCAAMVALC